MTDHLLNLHLKKSLPEKSSVLFISTSLIACSELTTTTFCVPNNVILMMSPYFLLQSVYVLCGASLSILCATPRSGIDQGPGGIRLKCKGFYQFFVPKMINLWYFCLCFVHPIVCLAQKCWIPGDLPSLARNNIEYNIISLSYNIHSQKKQFTSQYIIISVNFLLIFNSFGRR